MEGESNGKAAIPVYGRQLWRFRAANARSGMEVVLLVRTATKNDAKVTAKGILHPSTWRMLDVRLHDELAELAELRLEHAAIVGKYTRAVAYASELFQPGGRFGHALRPGQSCLTEGIRWLAGRVQELEAMNDQFQGQIHAIAEERNQLRRDLDAANANAMFFESKYRHLALPWWKRWFGGRS